MHAPPFFQHTCKVVQLESGLRQATLVPEQSSSVRLGGQPDRSARFAMSEQSSTWRVKVSGKQGVVRDGIRCGHRFGAAGYACRAPMQPKYCARKKQLGHDMREHLAPMFPHLE